MSRKQHHWFRPDAVLGRYVRGYNAPDRPQSDPSHSALKDKNLLVETNCAIIVRELLKIKALILFFKIKIIL